MKRRVWARRLAIVALLALALQQAWRHGRDYVFPDKFLVVEEGKIYRGAWQQPWPMRRIIRNYRIKTIIALAHPPGDPLVLREQELARQMGVRWVHIPIVEKSADGQRKTVADALERAAAVVADPANQPVYFHCHHGLNRAALVQIAYRTLHCGWSLDQALQEIARTPMGLVEVKHGVDYHYMPTFYEERVLPRRRPQTAAASPSERK
ncbi:MAG: dual specificity protein phosphatase family protein [Isosphaeraceae bacterium]|nr:dual specificity protein phosphatase family protein [Isosphaeraceae bacterium]